MHSSQALPSGVVTFLLTDIEGSTRHWEREPDRMHEALGRHDALLNAGVRRQHGHVVKSKGEGDSVFAVFEHVRDAVRAALVLQSALAVEPWPTSTPLRVRMALHTGQVTVHNADYNGLAVNRCARLRALASGGQVLLSGVTAQLTRAHLPDGASLRDLGTRQLRDLSTPERVWQLMHPHMPDDVAAPAEPALPQARRRTAFMLTDQQNRSADGREWGGQVRNLALGLDANAADGHIDCYASPNLAALLNAHYEGFRMPRLWEARVDRDLTPDDAIVACRDVTTARRVPLPALTGVHHARFAVLCARAAYAAGSDEQTQFGQWADSWLSGEDSSGLGARAVATALEAEADRGTIVGHPEEMMAANAARAALHAAGLTWRGGREHAAENTRAINLATDAVRTALRLARLDLPALADQAVDAVPARR